MKHTGWFDVWVTKNTVLAVSVMFVLAGYFFEIKGAPPGCDAGWCLKHSADVLLTLFYPAVVIAIFAVLTYFLPNQIFKTWARFAAWWTLLSLIWVSLTPHNPGADWIGVDQKPLLAFSLSVLFFAISTLIILFGSIRFYWYKK
jgi:hypothetical protein